MESAVSKFVVLFSFTDTYSFVLQDEAQGIHWKSTIFLFLAYFKKKPFLKYRELESDKIIRSLEV
jgi:hypothetical protein